MLKPFPDPLGGLRVGTFLQPSGQQHGDVNVKYF
jgi:hypothetical protein